MHEAKLDLYQPDILKTKLFISLIIKYLRIIIFQKLENTTTVLCKIVKFSDAENFIVGYGQVNLMPCKKGCQKFSGQPDSQSEDQLMASFASFRVAAMQRLKI